jgi:Zn-dependent membrane protease YugP
MFLFQIDPLYYLLMAPGLLLAIWAQARVSTAYARASRIPARTGLTGAEAAAEILRAEGVHGVSIEPVAGQLSDHYDPQSKVLRLSPDVYAGRSLAALGIAAHEAGHAAQDAQHDMGLVVRNVLVPAAALASGPAWVVFFAGLVLTSTKLLIAGMVLFSAAVLFQLVNLPVEYDASRRARRALAATGLVASEEEVPVRDVLSAAALTYVAATLSSVLTLLYFVLRSGLLGAGRRDD